MTATRVVQRQYDQARCAWCPEGAGKNAHVFIKYGRISPACPEHAAQYVIPAHRDR